MVSEVPGTSTSSCPCWLSASDQLEGRHPSLRVVISDPAIWQSSHAIAFILAKADGGGPPARRWRSARSTRRLAPRGLLAGAFMGAGRGNWRRDCWGTDRVRFRPPALRTLIGNDSLRSAADVLLDPRRIITATGTPDSFESSRSSSSWSWPRRTLVLASFPLNMDGGLAVKVSYWANLWATLPREPHLHRHTNVIFHFFASCLGRGRRSPSSSHPLPFVMSSRSTYAPPRLIGQPYKRVPCTPDARGGSPRISPSARTGSSRPGRATAADPATGIVLRGAIAPRWTQPRKMRSASGGPRSSGPRNPRTPAGPSARPSPFMAGALHSARQKPYPSPARAAG